MARRVLTPEETVIKESIDSLDLEMKSLREKALENASIILGDNISLPSLHGKIGGKNNDFLDSVNMSFQTPEEYTSSWIAGLIRKYKEEEHRYTIDLVKFLKDPILRQYTLLFLKKTFFKHYDERVRLKPSSLLWQVWFGYDLVFGLLIAPTQLPDGTWRIDRSAIRRADYQYWTVGHVISVGGFLNAQTNTIYKINDIDGLKQYYEHIVKSLSKSEYEQQICDYYIKYLDNSTDPLFEPLLIPEFRYGGKDKDHLYRLDFTVLNPYTFEFTGFELSPASSHMSTSKIKEKKLKDVNEELKEKWVKEMDKRNKYFQTFDIRVITFTDEHLSDISKCFELISNCLSKRAEVIPTTDSLLVEIDSL